VDTPSLTERKEKMKKKTHAHLAVVPDHGVRTPSGKAARMKATIVGIIGDMTKHQGDLPPMFLGIAPFIPILMLKLDSVDDETWLSLIEMLEARMHYVKTGDPIQ
jgi:hypothetical protein